MTTYTRCPTDINSMALEILCRFETHKPLLDAKVKIDFVFAMPELDEKTGNPKCDALKHHGVRAMGICRKVPLKERAMGRGDAEITIDQYWWESATEPDQMALLDHELHHIDLKIEHGGVVKDDLGRPIIKLRPHDFEVGWFKVIASRHGMASQERQQARKALTDMGQYFWPDLFGPISIVPRSEAGKIDSAEITILSGGKSVETTLDGLKQAAASVADMPEVESEETIRECVNVIRSEQKASVALLQRRLRLGYTRASRIMDELESRGIVGTAKGAEPRDILIDLNAVTGGDGKMEIIAHGKEVRMSAGELVESLKADLEKDKGQPMAKTPDL